jgi:DNA-binding HxlR family transcriptional regulator
MESSSGSQPKNRSYQQFCAMASALDVIGDRWALLIVRELMLGPRRFTELAAGLHGIGTDILTARLRALADAGVLGRVGAGRSQRYELTSRGRALRSVLAELGRWGAPLLDPPATAEELPARTGLTTLLLDPALPPPGLAGRFEIRCDGETAQVEVRDGRITIAPVQAPDPDGEPPAPATAAIDLTRAGLIGVIGGAAIADMSGRGDLVIRGDRAAGTRLIAALSSPPLLAGLTAKLPRH